MVILKCRKHLWLRYLYLALFGTLKSSTLKQKLTLNACAFVLLQTQRRLSLEDWCFYKSHHIVILILNAFLLLPPSISLLFRQTPSFLIPTVTTCTASPPSSTWPPPLTSHRRNDCEYNKTCICCPFRQGYILFQKKTAFICKHPHLFNVVPVGQVQQWTTWSVSMRRRREVRNHTVFTWTTSFASPCLHTTAESLTHVPTGTSMSLR